MGEGGAKQRRQDRQEGRGLGEGAGGRRPTSCEVPEHRGE